MNGNGDLESYPLRKVGQALREKCELAMVDRNVSFIWDKAVVVKANTKVPVLCLVHNTTQLRSVSDLAKNKYDCQHCLFDRYSILAITKGFTLLSKEGNSVLLCCNSCQSQRTIGLPQLLTDSGISCETCLHNKYKNLCKNRGLTLNHIVRTKREIHLNATCNACLVVRDISYSSITGVSGKRYNCPVCRDIKYVVAATQKGFLFDGHTADGKQLSLRCKIDNSTVCVGISQLLHKESNITCNTCRLLKFQQALSEKGCTFVRFLPSGLVEYIDTDGNTRVSRDILSRRFATNSKNRWEQQTSVYAIYHEFNGETFTKIGTAVLPKKRLKELKLLGKSEIFILNTFPTRQDADRLEKFLHKVFSNSKLDPLVASLFSQRQIIRTKQGDIRSRTDGITEWFYNIDLSTVKSKMKEYTDGT